MIKTNMEQLVETAVMGEICHPASQKSSFSVTYDGKPYIPVYSSGISYNIAIGSPAFGWAWGDHVEPGVSIKNADPKANTQLQGFSCVGNTATIVSSALDDKDFKIKGAEGVVTGKHGGADKVIIYFPKKIVEKLVIGDKIQIRACGTGLKLSDYPDIMVMNCGPRLFKVLNVGEKGKKIRLPVTKIVPGKIMGSGLGSSCSFFGDYDIQSVSPETVKEYLLNTIRLGDIVAITDHDCSHGPRYHPGSITVGVVIHGSSSISGHGPGVTALFSSPHGTIEPIISRKANIADMMGLS